ncbi:tetratricopeptide repeat protein [Paraburkholderia hayleyella]|uniref:tetratricopeptide repeat protein n=1 Tax=Paraburkholderia hayleyella TaxID=2152889 RepID=UPI001290C566|nr:tetratricopeptide repeat protein [Paraburkholderia hayleyella]
MKPSNGRVCSAKALAITALCGFTLTFFSASAAAAPNSSPLASGSAVRDSTPEIDASIAAQNWDTALAQLETRIAAHPRDAQAKFKRATVLARLKRDDEAIAAFTELTQIYPELPEPYNNLAMLEARRGHYAEARQALEMAIKVNPGYGLAYENLGDLYLRLASEAYRHAQDSGQASGTTRQRLGDIQKIIAPPPTPTRPGDSPAARAAIAAPPAPAIEAPLQTPGFQFGGPSGSMAILPYVAPSR